jgi:hypothetical protein
MATSKIECVAGLQMMSLISILCVTVCSFFIFKLSLIDYIFRKIGCLNGYWSTIGIGKYLGSYTNMLAILKYCPNRFINRRLHSGKFRWIFIEITLGHVSYYIVYVKIIIYWKELWQHVNLFWRCLCR